MPPFKVKGQSLHLCGKQCKLVIFATPGKKHCLAKNWVPAAPKTEVRAFSCCCVHVGPLVLWGVGKQAATRQISTRRHRRHGTKKGLLIRESDLPLQENDVLASTNKLRARNPKPPIVRKKSACVSGFRDPEQSSARGDDKAKTDLKSLSELFVCLAEGA